MEPDADEYEEMMLERISDRLRNRPEIAEELRKRATSSKYTEDWEEGFEKIGGFEPDAFPPPSGKPPGGGTPGGGGRSIDERLAAEGIPVRFPGRTGPRDPDFEMRREISTRDAFYGGQESGGKLFRIGDRYIEAANVDDAIRLATNEDGFEHYIAVPDIQTRFNVRTEDDLRRIITEASPEESAKYFDMKGGGRSIDDIEGPSEAEIQQMIETSKFGDPEELEMLKENMRRLAQAQQQADIARSNIRRTRTPGTPGEFSQPTEGTSRADRKSAPRERPEVKKKLSREPAATETDVGELIELNAHRNLLDKAMSSNKNPDFIPRWLRGAPGKELINKPAGRPRQFDNEGYVKALEDRGDDLQFVYGLNQIAVHWRNSLKQQYDEALARAYKNYPKSVDIGAINQMMELQLQLDPFRSAYDESINSMDGAWLWDFAARAAPNQVDLTSVERSVGLGRLTVNLAERLESALNADLLVPDHMKNPMLRYIKNVFESIGDSKLFQDLESKQRGYDALYNMFEDYKDYKRGQELIGEAFSVAHNNKRFTTEFDRYFDGYSRPRSDSAVTKKIEDPRAMLAMLDMHIKEFRKYPRNISDQYSMKQLMDQQDEILKKMRDGDFGEEFKNYEMEDFDYKFGVDDD